MIVSERFYNKHGDVGRSFWRHRIKQADFPTIITKSKKPTMKNKKIDEYHYYVKCC